MGRQANRVTRTPKNLAFYCFFVSIILIGLAFLWVGFSQTDYLAEKELPYYCMYRYEDEISLSVMRKDGALVEQVVCLTPRAEENAIKIGYRSMVYWGYRGNIPFTSSYAYGEDEPKMLQAQKDNYQRAKTFQMFGKDFSVAIFVVDTNGAVLWQGNYSPVP